MLVNMKQMVREAAASPRAVPAFNVFGYEDARAVIDAAEELGAPVILATNLVAVRHMPMAILGPMLVRLAEDASVPVCVHLDHGQDVAAAKEAIASGYSSVMFDGSQLPLEENIARTQEITQLAHSSGVSVEAEIGSVGYSDPSFSLKHELSDPYEVAKFVQETGIDAVAVSVGTVHRMETQAAAIDFARLQAIQELTDVPLVIHGSSGVPDNELRKLVTYRVGKINIGTALRMAFGHAIRQEMMRDPKLYDRIALFTSAMAAVKQTALNKYTQMGWER